MKETAPAIARLQAEHGLPPTGEADARVYALLGIPYPNLFQRCLGVTNAFEGTYYGDCNHTDMDNAGLTMGIIGFTSANGEVQCILREFWKRQPAMTTVFTDERRRHIESLLHTTLDPTAWGKFFFGPKCTLRYSKGLKVCPDILNAIALWGAEPEMRQLQRDHAAQYWSTVPAEVAELALDSGTEAETNAAYAMLFDIHVQNGPLSTTHRTRFHRLCAKLPANAAMRDRLWNLAKVIAQCATPRWRNDVLARKSLFANGEGIVHGKRYSLAAQGLA